MAKTATIVMVEAARVKTVILRLKKIGHETPERLRLIEKARIALNDNDVAHYIAQLAEHALIIALHACLSALREQNNDCIGKRIKQRQHQEQNRKPPVHGDGGRNQQNDADDRCQVLAQEREPKRKKLIGARQHDARHAAASPLSVVADRKGDGALKGKVHRNQALPVSKAVGKYGEHDACKNIEEPDCRPKADEREGGLGFGQRVDHAAEQNRLG
jgi:hypothetical protein